MNILFTCAGRRNYLINYFREFLEEGDKIYAGDMDMTAPALADADVAVKLPSIYDEDYIPTLIRVVETSKINAIISLNDLEAPILSKARAEFEKVNCHVLVSDDRVIRITFDKKETAAFLESIGLKTPLTFTNEQNFITALDEKRIGFPCVIKPRWGSASIGIEFPQDLTEFKLANELSKIKLKRTILAKASSADINEALLYQEKIEGKEYGLDILNDFQGNYVGSFAREKLNMRAGETDKAITVINDELEAIGRTISQNLRHIGNLDCDVLCRDGQYYVLEMNARFGGGYPFSHEAGGKGVACYVAWLKGEKDVSKFILYRGGVRYSKCDRLIQI